MLWEIGRFKPELFLSSLRSLLSCVELYEWERHALLQGLNQVGLIGMLWESDRVQKQLLEWESMEHRTLQVSEIALRAFLFEPAMADFFATMQARWREQRDRLSARHPLHDQLEEFSKTS